MITIVSLDADATIAWCAACEQEASNASQVDINRGEIALLATFELTDSKAPEPLRMCKKHVLRWIENAMEDERPPL